jgi:hypothetical protein
MPIVYGLGSENPSGVVLGGSVVGGEAPAWKCRKCGATFGHVSLDESKAKPLRKAGPKRATAVKAAKKSTKAMKVPPRASAASKAKKVDRSPKAKAATLERGRGAAKEPKKKSKKTAKTAAAAGKGRKTARRRSSASPRKAGRGGSGN